MDSFSSKVQISWVSASHQWSRALYPASRSKLPPPETSAVRRHRFIVDPYRLVPGKGSRWRFWSKVLQEPSRSFVEPIGAGYQSPVSRLPTLQQLTKQQARH
jgi:hypothetical protein